MIAGDRLLALRNQAVDRDHSHIDPIAHRDGCQDSRLNDAYHCPRYSGTVRITRNRQFGEHRLHVSGSRAKGQLRLLGVKLGVKAVQARPCKVNGEMKHYWRVTHHVLSPAPVLCRMFRVISGDTAAACDYNADRVAMFTYGEPRRGRRKRYK